MRTNYFFLPLLFMICHASLAQSEAISLGNDVEIIRISDNAYVHVSYGSFENTGRFSSNGLIIVKNKEAVLFDTPINDSLTQIITSWIIDSLNAKIIGFVPNHWHIDCMGGINHLKNIGVNTYANQMTIDICHAKHLSPPEFGFSDSLSIPIGDIDVQCYYFGPAHSSDNIVVWIPSEYILFGGCMIKNISSNGLGNKKDGNLKEWTFTIDKIVDKFNNIRFVIPGHGAYGGPELLYHTLNLLKDQPDQIK